MLCNYPSMMRCVVPIQGLGYVRTLAFLMHRLVFKYIQWDPGVLILYEIDFCYSKRQVWIRCSPEKGRLWPVKQPHTVWIPGKEKSNFERVLKVPPKHRNIFIDRFSLRTKFVRTPHWTFRSQIRWCSSSRCKLRCRPLISAYKYGCERVSNNEYRSFPLPFCTHIGSNVPRTRQISKRFTLVV